MKNGDFPVAKTVTLALRMESSQDDRSTSQRFLKVKNIPSGDLRQLWSMGDLQDPKLEVRQYHMFGHILWGYSLKIRLYIGLIYGRYLQFRILEWPLIWKITMLSMGQSIISMAIVNSKLLVITRGQPHFSPM